MSLEKVLELHTEQDAANFGKLETKVDQLIEDVGEIKTAMASQRGFLAGAMFVATGVWALLVFAGGSLMGWFR